MHIARTTTTKSTPLIATALGLKDHSTVVYGAREAEIRVKIDEEWARHDRAIRNIIWGRG